MICVENYWILYSLNIGILLINLSNAKSVFSSSTEGNKPTIVLPPTAKPSLQNEDIILGSCIWAIGRTCPDKDVSFHLYTRQNPQDAQYVHIDGNSQTTNLSQSFFDNRHPSKIIIHGYNANMFLHSLAKMKNEYLAKGDYNVFYVDWSTLALGPCYINAVHNIKHTGACVAQLVERIRDMNTSDIHIIGFSLGAHITNYIAKNLGDFILPRITGLDPALPLFVTSADSEKLDKSDAEYVDVIHTNALVQGKFERCGHADFYMNGGIFQPNCFEENPINPFPCFHHRALDYYLESIRSDKGFWGWPCSSYLAYFLGDCPRTNYLFEAGENIKNSTEGMFLVETNGEVPYAKGKWTNATTANGAAEQSNITKEESITTITQSPKPAKRVDRLLESRVPWEKLNYNFNNQYKHEPTPYSQDPDGDNWTYFGDDTEDVTPDRESKKETPLPIFMWEELKRNFRSSSIIGVSAIDDVSV